LGVSIPTHPLPRPYSLVAGMPAYHKQHPPSPRSAAELAHSSNVLRHLVVSYQEKMLWIYRTRAEYHLAIQRKSPRVAAVIDDEDMDSPDQEAHEERRTEEERPQDTNLCSGTKPVHCGACLPRSISRSRRGTPPKSKWASRKPSFMMDFSHWHGTSDAQLPERIKKGNVSDQSGLTLETLELYERMLAKRVASCSRLKLLLESRGFRCSG